MRDLKNILYKSYVALLIFAIIILIGFYVIPQGSTYNPATHVETIELEPQNVQELPDGATGMYLDLSDGKQGCDTLFLESVHCELKISANGTVIYCLEKGSLPWMSTTGSTYDFVSLPDNLEGVDVEIRKVYPEVSSCVVLFYLGNGSAMIKNMISNSFIPSLISVLDIFLGILMLVFWFMFRKEARVNISLCFLGLFAMAVGCWSLAESDIFIYLVKNHSAASFTSFISLMMFVVPFVQFTKYYYNRYCRFADLFSWFAIISEVILVLLHITGIAGVKETVTLVHFMLVAGTLYFIVCLVSFLKQERKVKLENSEDEDVKREINRKIKVNIIATVVLMGSCAVDFYLYYNATLQTTFAGRLGLLIYLAVLGGETTGRTLDEIERSRRMAIYKELAYKDNLTGLFNRNAYMEWEKKQSLPEEVSLINIDLNDLKKCNDEFGHAVGDKYISDSAEIILDTFQDAGACYRVGGDEFAVVVNAEVSREEIERRLKIMEEKQKQYNEKSEKVKIYMAYGFAKYDPRTDESIESVGSRADARMYAHKKEIKELTGGSIPGETDL